MNTKIKTALLTAAALVMTAGVSVAAPSKHYNNHGYGKPGYGKVYKKSGISAFERAQIARSAANLASLKRRVMRDGRVTPFERIQLRNAERRHAALVARAYRT
ncbi:hypothetical protein [Hyphomicrobium sp.]|uniref:hypothetical protein n=1 Tax=Hyphomicrobium sp. TaxID=82 RepID=UPI0025C0CD04|nr:hypothetical protein [Hyphomicrobium sp.]MCC7251768.1 hypothetical protein [Hyphomicrobium sp.]